MITGAIDIFKIMQKIYIDCLGAIYLQFSGKWRQVTQDVGLLLVWCWVHVSDNGPTFKQHSQHLMIVVCFHPLDVATATRNIKWVNSWRHISLDDAILLGHTVVLTKQHHVVPSDALLLSAIGYCTGIVTSEVRCYKTVMLANLLVTLAKHTARCVLSDHLRKPVLSPCVMNICDLLHFKIAGWLI